MSALPAKFTFDLDLGEHSQHAKQLNDTQIERMVLTARSEGYAEGLADGERTHVAVAASQLKADAEAMSRQAISFIGQIDAIEKRLRAEAIELAALVGSKLSHHLIAREPTAELDHLVRECLASIERAPHLVIRCNEALADKLREIAEAHIATSGFAGRLIVMGDPEIAVGDGRLEWADGGLVRDISAITAGIDQSIKAYIEATGAAALNGDNQ